MSSHRLVIIESLSFLTKLELIQTLRDRTDLSKSEAATAVNTFFEGMANSLAKGGRVDIRELCSLFVKKYKSYTGPVDGTP